MSLSKQELADLSRAVAATKDVELDCDQCLDQVAAFAERELAGLAPGDALRLVEAHLADCDECREEYRGLRDALRAIDPGT